MGWVMLTNSALLKLLQLASPTLPIGAYSYSEGLETLVDAAQITSASSLDHWLRRELSYGAVRVEAAVMIRAHRAILAEDFSGLTDWNHWLSAARETEELRSQSWQMGRSLLRLAQDLQPNEVTQRLLQEECNFAIAFGTIAAHWQIDEPSATLGYLYSWATNLISAGVKLIPLGQTAGQRLLLDLGEAFEQATPEILTLPDGELGSCGWGLALASMRHETLYSRLFRS